MNGKPEEKEERSDEGLSTAALAGVGEGRASGSEQVAAVSPTAPSEESAPLFTPDEARRLRSQWDEVQACFVDEPRRSVQQADNLVAAAMKRLAEMFAEERGKLEGQWDRGDDVSTEDLRLALRRYRSFFNRLLSI